MLRKLRLIFKMQEKKAVQLVWFREDLRLFDNPALHFAAKTNKPLIGIYIFDNSLNRSMGHAQRWWLHHSLNELRERFKKLGSTLYLYRGNTLDIMEEILSSNPIEGLFYNNVFTVEQQSLADEASRLCLKYKVKSQSFNHSILNEPNKVLNQKSEFYKVYTSFYKASIKVTDRKKPYPMPRTVIRKASLSKESDLLEDWAFTPHWSLNFSKYWEPGELGAQKRMKIFFKNNLINYHDARDIPSVEATSKLSPHIHFGEVSVSQLFNKTEQFVAMHPEASKAGETWIKQLFWRDFSYYLLYHVKDLPNSNYRQSFNQFPWRKDKKHLQSWQKGQTGYPIVDAGMRELWHSGTMHNRVRMIVASFLTKHLLIHWKEGEAWFWDTLLDADLANNVASWQWVQGCGADAAPYFRIFNPTLQSQKFDPNGEYIAKWVPELSGLPSKHIHEPWSAPLEVLERANITLDQTYPRPIVDHKFARERALTLYKKL